MPILQDEIQIKLTPNTIKYYEDLGYYIPRYRDSRGRLKVLERTAIIVNVKDLKKGAGVSVHVACDNCGKNLQEHGAIIKNTMVVYIVKIVQGFYTEENGHITGILI